MNNLMLIHIGTHKTATTFLQYNYFPAIKGVNYFHGDFAFSSLLKNDHFFQDNILLSNEAFSGVAWNNLWINGINNDFHWLSSFETNIYNLHKLFPDAQLLIFFRKHGDLLVSMYKQYIQEGGILKFNKFYSETGIIRKQDLSYSLRIKTASELFNKVYVLSYEDLKRSGNEFLDGFFERELNLFRNRALDTKTGFSNKSISGLKIELLRRINKPYNKFPEKLKKLIWHLGCSPRDILQKRLSFWPPKDPAYFQYIKKEINEQMKTDWEFVESLKWEKA